MIRMQKVFCVEQGPPYDREMNVTGPDTCMYNILKARHEGDFKRADELRKRLETEWHEHPIHVSYDDNKIIGQTRYDIRKAEYF